MQFTFAHNNIIVFDLQKSIDFYKEALNLHEVRRNPASDGSFILVFLGDSVSKYVLELTWFRDLKEPWNFGNDEVHLAFTVDDFDAAYKMHKEMGCICYENTKMGLYFIKDPDGYWMEIIPEKR